MVGILLSPHGGKVKSKEGTAVRKPAYQTKVVLGDELRKQIAGRAKADDRSVADEIRRRLERSIADDEDAATDEFVRDIRQLVKDIQTITRRGWTNDVGTLEMLQAGVEYLLEQYLIPLIAPGFSEESDDPDKFLAAEQDRLRSPATQ